MSDDSDYDEMDAVLPALLADKARVDAAPTVAGEEGYADPQDMVGRQATSLPNSTPAEVYDIPQRLPRKGRKGKGGTAPGPSLGDAYIEVEGDDDYEESGDYDYAESDALPDMVGPRGLSGVRAKKSNQLILGEEPTDARWFFGAMPRADADKLLHHSLPASFLVRVSSNGSYVLSCRQECYPPSITTDMTCHFLIERVATSSGKYFLVPPLKTRFESIRDVIRRLREGKDNLPLKLASPCVHKG